VALQVCHAIRAIHNKAAGPSQTLTAVTKRYCLDVTAGQPLKYLQCGFILIEHFQAAYSGLM
jgi:hypothetical protein